jgi:hypothetical protein
MASSLTAQLLLDLARGRHPLFAEAAAPEGALLQIVNTRHRTLLLQYGGAIDGLVNTTVSLATVIGGVLVGQSAGVPIYLTTYADGWPVHTTVDNVPYVDFSETPMAGDPFGQNGGTPGFPLPADFLKIILVACTLTDQTVRPVEVIREPVRLEAQRINGFTAFISGNRLVPVRPLASGNTNDLWASGVASIQLSYVALPELVRLTDPVILPAALHEALVAGLAESMAQLTPRMSPNERAGFTISALTLLAPRQRCGYSTGDNPFGLLSIA